MLARALPIAVLLVIVDYVARRWTAGDGVPAMVTGLALPPLVVAVLWMLLLVGMGALARLGRRLRRRRRAVVAGTPSGASDASPEPGTAERRDRIAA